MKSVFFFVLFIMFFFNACASKYTLLETNSTVVSEPPRNYYYEYKIQPHDRLLITSYKFPEVTPNSMNEKGILVDSAGYINLPLIKRVHVAGLTQNQAARLLERKYSKYLRNPSFNVEVLNKRIYVLGEVRKPGVVPLDREQMSILEAIAYAGGLSDNAVRDNIIVISKDPYTHKMHMRKIDLTNFDALQRSNIILKPDDIVYVQPNTWKKFKVTSQNFSALLGAVNAVATPYLLFTK